MERFVLENLLDKINGCTFANIDTVTVPSKGIRKETTGTRVILFTNKKSSGYENMVKRRLVEAGKDPDNFVASDLPWGEQVPNSPLVINGDKVYLKCILLTEGRSRFFYGDPEPSEHDREISGEGLMLRGRSSNQGLPPSDEVKVACYKLSSIKKITLMGETLAADSGGVLQISGA